MLSLSRFGLLIFLSAILLLSQASNVGLAGSSSESSSLVAATNGEDWREASLTRVVVRSDADWARILFDDLNGTNTNGIRIKSVANSGWLEGKDSDDQLFAGRKIAWPDTEFDRIIARKGDMVAFFKGLRDFHYAEAYADLILEINFELPRVYVWLMTGGNGTTTFEIVSQDTGGTIWRDIVVGTGETQQVKRVMSPQPFFRPGRTETTVVIAWLSIIILVMIVLNFPILEVVSERIRKVRRREGKNYGDRGERKRRREENAGPS